MSLKDDKEKQIPLFMIDASVLQKMFEKEETSLQLLGKLREIKNSGKPFHVFTTQNNYLRAILTAHPMRFDLMIAQWILYNFKFIPSDNFKDDEKCIEETIIMADALTKKKNVEREDYNG